MAQFGICIRRGAVHNSITGPNGLTRDLSDTDTQQRKANEYATRKGVVDLFADFGNKQGSDRRKQRRERKGWKS